MLINDFDGMGYRVFEAPTDEGVLVNCEVFKYSCLRKEGQ